MNNETSRIAAPYASYRSFINFINTLGETTVPSRIDRSVFGKMSGGAAYSILASMKALKLIDEQGVPQEILIRLVDSGGEERKIVLKEILEAGYPSFWDGSINLKHTTPGQFDEHVREHFAVRGSTVDKVAAFFLSAAEEAGIDISAHLKNRKPTAPSSSSRKSQKARKTGIGDNSETDPGGTGNEAPPAADPKKLTYQLVDLLKLPDVNNDVKQAVWTLVQFLSELEGVQDEDD